MFFADFLEMPCLPYLLAWKWFLTLFYFIFTYYTTKLMSWCMASHFELSINFKLKMLSFSQFTDSSNPRTARYGLRNDGDR